MLDNFFSMLQYKIVSREENWITWMDLRWFILYLSKKKKRCDSFLVKSFMMLHR